MRGIALAGWLLLAAVVLPAQSPRFDHQRHARYFPSCLTCHEGAASASQPLWPAPSTCAACHDGSIQPAVRWAPPATPPPSNLRFSHATHPDVGAPEAQACTACHVDAGAPPMAVRGPVAQQCLACHGIRAAHLSAPDGACATCHLPLAQATRLTTADIARFPSPPSHRQAGFAEGGHGTLARIGSASCATCHARDFCASCHVNAPDEPVIRALPADPRSLAISASMTAPASHHESGFLERHGVTARKNITQCSTCHTRESCSTCHVNNSRTVAAIPAASAGRATGAAVTRRPPASHVAGFREHHGADAEANRASCSTCHQRAQCLECHRPSAGASPNGYHPAGFLTRHPAAAYARENSCANCHNPQQFCVSCHATSGFRTRPTIGAGFHDAKQFFLLGHGPAARQNLESCVTCHAERDCLSCHASQGGRRFNPHGPGFDAARMKAKNPEPCTVCHGASIPTGP